MSASPDPNNPPPPADAPPPAGDPAPYVIPVRYVTTPPPGAPTGPPPPLPPVPPRRGVSPWLPLLALALFISLGINLLLILLTSHFADLMTPTNSATEAYYQGKSSATDKIAIISVDGVIMEGANAFARQQIDQAAKDKSVRALVLRVNSPGGTITGSDDLYRRLIEVRDGSYPQQKGGKKPIYVSMGAMATSGGYYIAMPAKTVFAEETTITGSIGVFAAFPNIAKLSEKYGFGMEVIKAGDIKDSGSMFKEMKPEERQVWQDMVDNAYRRFTAIVDKGRLDENGKSRLVHRLTDVAIRRTLPEKDDDGKPIKDGAGKPKTFEYVRRLADGGIWTAQQAKEFGLVDQIGYLDEAVKYVAKDLALGENYRAVKYERPPTIADLFFGVQSAQPAPPLDAGRLAEGAAPRLWYLAPQAELAGVLTAIRGNH